MAVGRIQNHMCSVLLVICLTATTAQAYERVRMTLSGPGCPYASVVYEVARKKGVLRVLIQKNQHGPMGRYEQIGLLDERRYADFTRQVEGLLSNFAGEKQPSNWQLRYQLELSDGKVTHNLSAYDPMVYPEPALLTIWKQLRTVVEERTGSIPFWDGALTADESGFLRVHSTPSGRVLINGVDTGRHTPTVGLRVPVGVHEVSIQPVGKNSFFRYEARVEARKTTVLDVELR